MEGQQPPFHFTPEQAEEAVELEMIAATLADKDMVTAVFSAVAANSMGLLPSVSLALADLSS